jgi:Xaa-Pro aminopeptidase
MMISSEGHNHMMRTVAPGLYEYELAAEFYNFVSDSNIEKYAYSPIVGSGRDSAILHYVGTSIHMLRFNY